MTTARLDIDERGAAVVARVTGEFDAANASALGDAIEGAVTHETHVLAIDLAAVTYLDSAAIHLLFRVGRALSERGARLCLVVPPGSIVEDTLRYADALRLFQIAATTEEARAAG